MLGNLAALGAETCGGGCGGTGVVLRCFTGSGWRMVNGALVNHMVQVRTSFPITVIFSLSLLLLLLCLLGSTGTMVMRYQLLVKQGAYAFRGSKGGEAIRDCEPLTDTIGNLDFNRFIG